MKTTINGYRLNRNGKVIANPHEIIKDKFEGQTIKVNGEYYYYQATRNGKHIYWP